MLPKRKTNPVRPDNTFIVIMIRQIGVIESVLHVHQVAPDWIDALNLAGEQYPNWTAMEAINYDLLNGRLEDLDFPDIQGL